MVKAIPMGDFRGISRDTTVVCPKCGGLMDYESTMCSACSARERARVQSEAWKEAHDAGMLERHRRFTAALEAGWSLAELIAGLPTLPTDEEIESRERVFAL